MFVQEETDFWADVEHIHFSPRPTFSAAETICQFWINDKRWSHTDISYSKMQQLGFAVLFEYTWTLKGGASFCKVVWQAEIQETEPFKRRWDSW